MDVSDQPLYRDWELLHQCDLDLDRMASLHGIKLPSNSGTDLAELLDECVAWRIVVRRQEPEETDDKYVTVLKSELSKARSYAMEAVIKQLHISRVRLQELDAALSDNRGESSANQASRVRTTWAMIQVGKQPLELSESDGPTLEEMRTDLRNVRPRFPRKPSGPKVGRNCKNAFGWTAAPGNTRTWSRTAKRRATSPG